MCLLVIAKRRLVTVVTMGAMVTIGAINNALCGGFYYSYYGYCNAQWLHKNNTYFFSR